MSIKEKIIEFLKKEKEILIQQEQETKLLSDDEKIEKGILITNCNYIGKSEDKVFLRCSENNSKFRTGDSVFIQNTNSKQTVCKILENTDYEVILETTDTSFFDSTDSYSVIASSFNQFDLLIGLLESIVPGVPGMSFLNYLDNANTVLPRLKNPFFAIPDDKIKKYIEYLDDINKQVVEQVLQLPDLFCIQGPPGTGKTTTLSTIANDFYNENKSILILANTHQAVNNALSKIKEINKNATVIKIGQPLKNENLNTALIPIERDYNSYKKKKKNSQKTEIIGMTIATALVQMGLKTSLFSPEILLVDEASQIPMAAASVLGLYKAYSIIFFGDEKQMPPIFAQNNTDLSKSIFEYLKFNYPQCSLTLNKTYRLNKDICSLINDYFYATKKDEIIFSSVQKKQMQLDFSNVTYPEYKIITDSNHSLFCFTHPDTTSKDSNMHETEMICKLLLDLNETSLSNEQICIVAPYRRQVKLIKSMALQRLKELPIIDTVERVQGIDTDITIVSMCSSELSYIKEFSEFLFNKNRMNVMLSRARHKIILFCSQNILQTNNYFSNMINNCFKIIE